MGCLGVETAEARGSLSVVSNLGTFAHRKCRQKRCLCLQGRLLKKTKPKTVLMEGWVASSMLSSKDRSYTVGLWRREAENLSREIPPSMWELASSFIVDDDVDFIVEQGPNDHVRIANKDSGGSRVLASLQQKLDWIKVVIQGRKESSAIKVLLCKPDDLGSNSGTHIKVRCGRYICNASIPTERWE